MPIQSKPLRTIVYIDGFNLYYRSLKKTPYKWLDLFKMSSLLLPPEKHDIISIKYFTARISVNKLSKPTEGPDAPTRQDIYLRAIRKHCPILTIIEGHFLTHPANRPLACGKGTVKVLLTEEKGTDVNLAVHFLNDAWNNKFDCGVLVSNDSDLAECLHMVRELNKTIGWLIPGDDHHSKKLSRYM
jgi:uncharacterized LabA/DUF88 family protein